MNETKGACMELSLNVYYCVYETLQDIIYKPGKKFE